MPQAAKKKQPTKKAVRSKAVPRAIVHQICGLSDPFCNHANGAKFPDVSNQKTFTISRRGRVTLNSGANGNGTMMFYPRWGYVPIAFGASGVFPVVDSWTDFVSDGLNLSVMKYRVNTCGFTVTSIMAPLEASGELDIRSYNLTPNDLLGIDVLGYNCDQKFMCAARKVDGLAAVPSFTTVPRATFFDTSFVGNNPTSISSEKGFMPLVLSYTGCPVQKDCFVLEWVVNYEVAISESSPFAQAMTPPPPSNQLITDSVSRVQSTLKSNFFEKGIAAASRTIEEGAVAAVGGLLGGPQGAIAADALFNLAANYLGS